MPPDHSAGPLCPNCHSRETDRLPFSEGVVPYPVYSCGDCGHVWRQANSKPETLNRRHTDSADKTH